MYTASRAELIEQGAAFRHEVFTDDFLAKAGDHIADAPYAVIGQYAQSDFYHVTHASRLPAIRAEGLRSDAAVIDADDERFFKDQFERQMSWQPDYNDQRLVEKFILGQESTGNSRGVYLTGQLDALHVETYAVPERMKFFMRNLHHLSLLGNVHPAHRQQAETLVQKYSARIVVDGQVPVATLHIDPRSPAVARATLGRYDFASIDDDTGLVVMRQVQKDGMIEVKDTIAPEHIDVALYEEFDGRSVLDGIINRDAWVVFRNRQAAKG